MVIAIQGEAGSYHDLAAQEYYNNTNYELYPCRTFHNVLESLTNEETHQAVYAVENTLVGSILPNYGLIESFPVSIIGEIYLQIQHNLMTLPGQDISIIKTVRSHPMALLQCSNFLEKNPQIKGIETFDTAGSAREIAENKLTGVATIASVHAAKMYKLEIIATEIQNLKQNYTRFLILTLEKNSRYRHDEEKKASLNFILQHKKGTLAQFLDLLHKHQINLTLIQSIPIPGRPNEYAFHLDIQWDNTDLFYKAMEKAQTVARKFKILGTYKAGTIPYDN